MIRSLRAAPSIPHPHVDGKRTRGAADPPVRGGEVAPSEWITVWLTLIDRLDLIQEARKPEPRLAFDSNDQARLA